MTNHTKEECKNIDHYKCTWEEDHNAGLHKLGMWWCKYCVEELGDNSRKQ